VLARRPGTVREVRMTGLEIVIVIVVGGVIGWLASILMGTNAQMGILANVLVGILGSWLGFWLAPRLGFVPVGSLARWLVAIGGAALLLLVLKVLGVFR
jgi:uncharacterized membrane protein YeaQ/YmgE (transglycosylase-associated protein family)